MNSAWLNKNGDFRILIGFKQFSKSAFSKLPSLPRKS